MRLRKLIETQLDNFTVRKKLIIIYIICILIPIILTDSVILYIVAKSERNVKQHEMENTANAISYNLFNTVDNVARMAKSIYTSQNIDDFLTKQYESPIDYYAQYQNIFQDTLFEKSIGRDHIVLTMYVDNATVVNGGKIQRINSFRSSGLYQYIQKSGMNQGMYFEYGDTINRDLSDERQLLYFQKLNFFSKSDEEKILVMKLDYNSLVRDLQNMNYNSTVYVCYGDKIILSNANYPGLRYNFETFDDYDNVGFKQTFSVYGVDLDLYVMNTNGVMWEEVKRNAPLLMLLIIMNVVLPLLLVRNVNRSFTTRIQELSKVFKSVDSEQLIPIENARGKDEIGSLMRNYNRMVSRTNELIQIVYKNKLREQEILVAQKNAELLALHSQINPHFLFNALESLRMHSLLKQENETAEMVEKLALIQRQYVEWGEDFVEIKKEMEFVKAYLGLQKYRFGERLSYSLDVKEECLEKRIPKLTLVTFVENACVHGIEGKSSPGWVFVRVYTKEENLCLEVEDTGNGMEEQAMAELLSKMKNANIEMLKGKGRVGVINACLRLKMMSADRVAFELEGEEGVGTLVNIQIPLEFV